MTSDKSHCCMQHAAVLQCCMQHCIQYCCMNQVNDINQWVHLFCIPDDMRRNRESISIPWSPWLVLVWPIRWRSQSSSQDQPQPHFALAELLITGHQSGGSEAQPGPSSLHLWSRSSLTVAWLETLQSPTCCPAPWLPHSAEARSKRKPINHLSSPVSSQVNTKQNLWINELYSDSGV